MAAAIEKQPSSSELTGKKRKRKYQKQKLLMDERVEVKGIEEKFLGSWHLATIIGRSHKKRVVEYDHFLFDVHNGKLIETLVISPDIRPLPPPVISEKTTLCYGQCVDVFCEEAWWEGVIIDEECSSSDRRVFFPDTGNEMTAQVSNLRISQDYDHINDNWKCRGKWTLLELLAEIKENWVVVISVQQIWYEVRGKKGFENFNAWNSVIKESWNDLVFPIVLDSFKLSVKSVFEKVNPKLDEKFQSIIDHVVSEIELESKLLPNVESQTIQESKLKDDLRSRTDDQSQTDQHIQESKSMPCGAKSQTSQHIQENKIEGNSGGKSQRSQPFQESKPEKDSSTQTSQHIQVSKLEEASVPTSDKTQTGQQTIQETKTGEKISIAQNAKSQTSQHIQESKLEEDSSMPPSDNTRPSQQPIQESKIRKKRRITRNVESQTSHPIQEIKLNDDSPSMSPSSKSQTGQQPNLESKSRKRKRSTVQKGKLEADSSSVLPSVKSQSGQQRIQEIDVKDDLASLMEGGSFISLLTNSTTVHEASPQPLDSSPFSPDDKIDSCQSDTKIVKRRSNSLVWQIAGPDLIPDPKYCPSAIIEYYKKYMSRSRQTSTDMTNVRRHLKFSGWKIHYWKDGKYKSKYRYYSPESKPKVYYSLNLLCKDLTESCPDLAKSCQDLAVIDCSSRDSYQNDQNTRDRSSVVNEQQAEEESKDSLTVLSSNHQNTLISCSPLSEVIEKEPAEPENCPESIKQYVLLCGDNSFRSRQHDKKLKDLRLQVKEHLISAGWSIFFIKKGTRQELRYQSPGNRVYISLLAACQSFVGNGGRSDKKSQNSRRKRPSIRARNYIAPVHHTPRTVLCWLIDNQIITIGDKVFHGCENGEEGRVTREGIECGCCLEKFSLAELEIHLGGENCIPASNIYLEDGRSLLDCQKELRKNVSNEVKGGLGNLDDSSNDYICSICHDGGDLMLCDQCPSSFHTSCLGLKDVPEGDWFCPSCCCGVCGKSGFDKDCEKIICDQCEHQYHAGCVNNIKNRETLESYPKGKWFCNIRCEEIFMGLEGILGKPFVVKGAGRDNLTWTLLKHVKSDISDDDSDEVTEKFSKLNVALGVMHECFERVKEPRTNTDIVEDVIFNRCSDLRRLNFKGFYTVILEKGDEIISAATVRVFGEKVAELPLVGTAFRFRRLGMCRVLMDELEKKLRELGVEMLVLPAIASVLDTWTGRFGFSKMTEPERLNLLDYTFLYFQDTTMCRKLLLSDSELIVAEEQNKDVINGNELMNLENNENVPEELAALQILESGNIEESSLGPVNENEMMALESTGNVPEESLALQIHESGNVEENSLGNRAAVGTNKGDSTNNDHIVEAESIEYPPLETDVNDIQYEECERDEHGRFKRCKRRKVPI